MSQDFAKVLIKDDRLNVSDQIKYGVIKGGQNMTPSIFQAVSQSITSHTYNVQVPSEQTIIDRRVLWRSTVTLNVTSNAPASSPSYFNYGLDTALAPFPLHQSTSVMTATINNNSVSINMRDVLPAILRFNDRRELARYNGYTPTAYDTVSNYNDAIGTNQNVLGQWLNNTDNDLVPRGSYKLLSVTDSTGNPPPAPDGTSRTLLVTFEVSEPLLISPFIFCDPKSNNQGFYGIQNLNFVFNIGSATRMFRTVSPFITAITINQFTDSSLIFNFLTPHPSDLIPARNCVGYYELPRYITNSLPAFAPYDPTLTQQPEVVVNSQNIQLNQIPDKLIIFVRKSQGIQTVSDPDFFLTIKGISINFNNQSGILASATPQDLYRYSVENGSNQSWYEFSGYANVLDTSSRIGSKQIGTAGSMLVLQFGKDIQLVEDFYSSGSLGNFNLQIRLSVENQTGQTFTAGQTELVIITMNSGVFCCERGTSSVFTGLLTKQDVLDASTQEPYTMSDAERLVGGGFLDTLKSVSGKLLPKLPSVAKGILGAVDNKYAKAGADVLGALGYGKSGAGMSAGGMSAGGMSAGGVSGGALGATRSKLLSRVM